MTHVPETGAINQLHFSGAGFWYVCHANLGPDSSGTRFRRRLEHCSISSQKVACSAMHVTEMVTYDWSMIIADVFRCILVVILLQFHKLRIHHLFHFQPCLFSAPEIFIPDSYHHMFWATFSFSFFTRVSLPCCGGFWHTICIVM